MTSLELRNIVSAGGNVIVNSDDFSVLDLKNLAAIGKTTKSNLIIKKANKLSALDCRNIASVNPGKVTFDFIE